MAVSKREKYIGIGAGAAVGILVLNYVVLNPFIARRDAYTLRAKSVSQQQSDAIDLMGRKRRLDVIWNDIVQGGLKVDASSAESQAQHAVLYWAQTSGINLAAMKPERSTTEGAFQIISFHVTGTGTMPQVARLLWALETPTIPVRVNDMAITPRKEGTDDLSIQLSISTLSQIPDSLKTKAGISPVAMTGGPQ